MHKVQQLYYNCMQSYDLQLLKNDKNQRRNRHLSDLRMRKHFNSMIENSSKHSEIIKLLNNKVIRSKATIQQEYQHQKNKQIVNISIINQIQNLDHNFNPTIETKHFHRGIDYSLQKLHFKSITHLDQKVEEFKSITSPSSPQNIRKISINKEISRKSAKYQKRYATISSKDDILEDSHPKLEKKISTNPFLFRQASKAITKLLSIKMDMRPHLQDQLFQNLNIIQNTSIKSKSNMKIERQKLSSYLKNMFMNEIITTYYKFEATENFYFLKNILEELIHLKDKEHKMIAFFTYDINQDGYICQEDIYYFLERLPFNAKIMSDLNMIIQFLRKNELRSQNTNLPTILLKQRQKYVFDTFIGSRDATNKFQRKSKKPTYVDKLFTVAKHYEKQSSPVKNSFKKFQINFQVFSLIFSERLPIIIPEIIRVLTTKVQIPSKCSKESNSNIAQSNFLERKSQDWMKRMRQSIQIMRKGKTQNLYLSQKII